MKTIICLIMESSRLNPTGKMRTRNNKMKTDCKLVYI